MKIHVDASRIHSKESTIIGFIVIDSCSRVITEGNKRIRDCPIPVAKCLSLHGKTVMAIHKKLQRIITESDSQYVVNAIDDKAYVPSVILNLVEDIKIVNLYLSVTSIEYGIILTNKKADVIAK